MPEFDSSFVKIIELLSKAGSVKFNLAEYMLFQGTLINCGSNKVMLTSVH